MTHDPLPATKKPDLDDLLTSMGITREELTEMTADDLFAAATRWQDATTTPTVEDHHFISPADRLLDSVQWPSADPSTLN